MYIYVYTVIYCYIVIVFNTKLICYEKRVMMYYEKNKTTYFV